MENTLFEVIKTEDTRTKLTLLQVINNNNIGTLSLLLFQTSVVEVTLVPLLLFLNILQTYFAHFCSVIIVNFE